MAPRTRTQKVLPPVDTRADDAITQKLLAWARGRFGRAIADVFAWRSPVDPSERHFALYGKAQNLSRALGINSKLTNYYQWLDDSLASAFSINVARSDFKPFLTQYDSQAVLGPSEILDALEDVIANRVLHVEPHDVNVALITEPGYPYFGPGTVYYSAATGQHYAASQPPWEKRGEGALRGDVLGGRGARPVADWCQLARRSPVGMGALNFSDNPRDPIFVTHSLGLGHGWRHEEAALEILRCQGLLFPSFAVGAIPASQFGPCSLFANAELVRRELKPYRQRGQSGDVVLYATDASTPGTANIVSTIAAKLYDQLTGRTNSASFAYDRHLYAGGLPLEHETESVAGGAPIVTTMSDAVRRLKRRYAIWRGPMNPAQFHAATERVTVPLASRLSLGLTQNSADKFPFLEAKAHVIVPMAAFTLAIVPDVREVEYRQFLASIGFRGHVRVLSLSPEERVAFEEASGFEADERAEEAARVRYNYAWRVAAEAKLAMREGDGHGVW